MTLVDNLIPAGRIRRPVTTPRPQNRPEVFARLVHGADEAELVRGRALGWTRDAVLVAVTFDGYAFRWWLPASDVRRVER